jgi:S1/P1 Nuclease
MILRSLFQALICAALLVTSTGVFAWGSEGHRVSGLIAESMLTPRARLTVSTLLDGGSLADASVFMDVYREALKLEVPGSERWHFNNRAVCEDAPLVCPDGNCASAQIPRQFAILSDTSKTKVERQQALRFLVHMVGDIHQPLHTADDSDLGGNRKPVFMPMSNFPRNLHSVWDSDIVKVAFRGRSETEVARDLINEHQKSFREWMRGDVKDWMSASYGLAKRLVYGQLPVFQCVEKDGKKSGTYNGMPWPEMPYELPQDYVKGAAGVVPVLIAQSGARIGGMLNAALDPRGVPVFGTPFTVPALEIKTAPTDRTAPKTTESSPATPEAPVVPAPTPTSSEPKALAPTTPLPK